MAFPMRFRQFSVTNVFRFLFFADFGEFLADFFDELLSLGHLHSNQNPRVPHCRFLEEIRKNIIRHHPFPHQKKIGRCFEFAQMTYNPQPSHFSIENGGLIISWYKIRWCPIIRTCLVIQYLPYSSKSNKWNLK